MPFDSRSARQFDAAYRAYRPGLLRFLRRKVGSEADADEISQEAYIRLLRYAGMPDAQALKPLLYRIAINLIGMGAREARRRHAADHVSVDSVELHSHDIPQDQQLIDRERLAQLLGVVDALPEKCREVFILNRINGLSYAEVARRCGISVKMVEKQVSKALGICRMRVGDREP